MQKYQYVKALSHQTSNKHNFHIFCHGHEVYENIHKVQGLSLEEGAVNFDLQKQRTFGKGQMYTKLKPVSAIFIKFLLLTK